jgi:phosphoribosylaminoimidazole-succinocarboxamide synthase
MSQSMAELPIVKNTYNGKVRDIYDLGDTLLIVTSDRISAFDVVFPNLIPDKGKILNQISVFFFEKTKHIVKNHFITAKVEEYPPELHPFKAELDGRSMLVKKTRVLPFECIVRGYISGSAWQEYQRFGTVSDMIMPDDLKESQRFPNPLFTPSTKATDGHDENISYHDMVSRIDENIAEHLKHISISLYKFAHDMLKDKGILIADTKFEFGTIGHEIYLIDEVFTPDSSRFWDVDEYVAGTSPKSFDKQYIRDYVLQIGWDKEPPAPELPKDVITATLSKYKEAYYRITGDKKFQ